MVSIQILVWCEIMQYYIFAGSFNQIPMTKLFFTLSVLLFSIQLKSQIPLTITEFDFEATLLIQIAVGDADANGRTDIYLIAEGANKITRLTNLGNGTSFTNTDYLTLPKQPSAMGILSLNGGDDMYYTLVGEKGINTLYSMDPYNNEKKVGPKLLDSLGGLLQAHMNYFFYSQLMMTSDTAGDIHLAQIINGSFNVIVPATSHTTPTDFMSGVMSSFTYGDSIVFFIPDITAGRLLKGKTLLGAPQAIYNDQLTLVDNDLQHPVATLSYTDSTGLQLMFVLDTGSHEIYKYTFTGSTFTRTSIDATFTNPTKMAMGYMDNDEHIDLVVADGNNLWLLSNAPTRSSGVQQELITSYDEPIADFFLADFDGNGISDIVSIPDSKDKVLVSRNDILLANHEIQSTPFGYWPNPADQFLYFSADQRPQVVKIVSQDGRVFAPQVSNDRIVLKGIPSGLYFIQTQIEDRLYIDKIHILNGGH